MRMLKRKLPTPNPSQEGNSRRTYDTLRGVLQALDHLSDGESLSHGEGPNSPPGRG
jgi:hypothetical protein